MKMLVTGAGRGGTNLVTELMRLSNLVEFTKHVEDRKFLTYGVLLPKYATKLATENKGFSVKAIDKILKSNPDLIVVFSLRNPIDNCLSKIVRGQPKSKGGDSTVEQLAPDATVDGAIQAIKHMFKIYKHVKNKYPEQFYEIKLEDLVSNPDKVILDLKEKFDISNIENMKNFHKRNRNKYQKDRYGNELHNQVDLYLDLDNNFDGFFKNKKDVIEKISTELNDVITELEY